MDPFLPEGARVLLLGSFPPPRSRWSMDFFFLFDNPETFILGNTFNRELIRFFCKEKGIALYDTAVSVVRGTGNASDKFLEVIRPVDLAGLLDRLPCCDTIAVTGQKAADTLLGVIRGEGFGNELKLPHMGAHVSFIYKERTIRLFRMPSSSRAYPMPLQKKASYYRILFQETLPAFRQTPL